MSEGAKNERRPLVSNNVLAVLLIANIVMLAVVLAAGALVVNSALTRYKSAARTLDQVSLVLDRPEMLVDVVTSGAETWLLGQLNGSIPKFAQNILSTDIAHLASQLNAFSFSVMNSFDGPPPSSCYWPLTCPASDTYVQCSNGQTVFCYNQGEVVNCANQTCIAGYVQSIASMIQAVSSNLLAYAGPVTVPTGNAALSSGLFNLANVIPWIERQTSAADWQQAGVFCKEATSALKRLRFDGAYVGFGGNQHIYNATRNVMTVVQYVDQICDDLLTLKGKRQTKRSNRQARRGK
jgi:hypothetical protein